MNGEVVSLLQRTRYPWDGNVIIEILDDCELSLNLRMPGWCQNNVEININGDIYTDSITPGNYIRITRTWSVGDSVCIQFPMPVRTSQAHPDDSGKANSVALMRGPLLYCFESIDSPLYDLNNLILPVNHTFTSSFQPNLLDGVQIIEVSNPSQNKPILTAIPYYAWGNREPGHMRVWLRED